VYWNRLPAADLLFASYRGFCEDAGREPVRPGFFVELFEGILPTGVRSDRRIVFRGCRADGDGCPDAARPERVLCYHMPPLAECREAFAVNAGWTETWSADAGDQPRDTPVTRAPDRNAVRMWWRWKLALGCIIPDERTYPGQTDDGPTYEWDFSASASALHGDLAEFCRRHGRQPVEFNAFLSEFAAVAPARIPADTARDEVDIPPLEECRAWFAANVAGESVPWPIRAESGD
jgi:hypothetical protein